MVQIPVFRPTASRTWSSWAIATIYVPSKADAYHTLEFITYQAEWGHLLRGLHFFDSAMVLFIGIHVTRTFLMAAYKYPREMSWLSGAALLMFTILMGFAGQLLRWDQTAVWSVYVAAEQGGRVPVIGKTLAHFILGGNTVGGATLSRFFAHALLALLPHALENYVIVLGPLLFGATSPIAQRRRHALRCYMDHDRHLLSAGRESTMVA